MPKNLSEKAFLFDLLFIVPVAIFYFIFFLGNGSLASWDEAIYAGVAKNILATGDWLNLTWGGGPWFDKPPLAIWGTALAYKIFGVSEFSARFFSGLCGAATVVATYILGTKAFGRWTGLLGALALASSTHFLRFSRFGMLDAPLTLCITLSMLAFWLGRADDRWLVASGVFMGLGYLTKSFGALLVIPITWLFSFWAGETAVLKKKSYWAGIAALLAIALPWIFYTAARQGQGYFDEAFLKHIVLRSTTAVEGHSGTYYFYIRTMINKYHPWILVGIVSGPYFLYKAARSRRPEFILISVWMFLYLGVITAMRTKLAWYVMPLYPALSLSVGWALGRMIPESRARLAKLAFLLLMPLHIPFSHLFHQDYSHDIKGIAPMAKTIIPVGKTVSLYQYNAQPEALFYLERPVDYVSGQEALRTRAQKEDFFCLIYEKDLKSFENGISRIDLSETASFGSLHLFKGKTT